MKALTSLLDASRRSLARHLDRLRETLDTMGERLREAIARAIGQTVSDAVHEAVHTALTDRPPPLRHRSYDWPRDPPPLYGREAPYAPWTEEPDDWYEPDEEPREHEATPPKTQRVTHAVLIGCEAAAWWLRRTACRFPVLAAVGVGLMAAAIVTAGNPVIATGLGLAGSTLGLLGLTHKVQAGVAALATITTS